MIKFYDQFCRACDEIRPRFEELSRSLPEEEAVFYHVEVCPRVFFFFSCVRVWSVVRSPSDTQVYTVDSNGARRTEAVESLPRIYFTRFGLSGVCRRPPEEEGVLDLLLLEALQNRWKASVGMRTAPPSLLRTSLAVLYLSAIFWRRQISL